MKAIFFKTSCMCVCSLSRLWLQLEVGARGSLGSSDRRWQKACVLGRGPRLSGLELISAYIASR